MKNNSEKEKPMSRQVFHPAALFLPLGMGAALLLAAPESGRAAVTGLCSSCHTMHNSQDGQPVTKSGQAKPYLNSRSGSTSCWGCHGGDTGNNIDPLTGAPQIRHKNANDLAGGNFAYITRDKLLVTGTIHTVGHNVIDIHEIDLDFDPNFDGRTYPPGDAYSQASEGFAKNTFTCAGQFGCHGDRTKADVYQAMSGAHHTGDSILKFGSINETLQGGSVGTSYRFLKGVKGGEDSDWQATASAIDHNEYKGAATPPAESVDETTPAGATMSGFCAECHSRFHGTADTGSATPWLRHPTDISLPATGEYAAYTTYNPAAPVGRTAIPIAAASGQVTPAGNTDDIVLCLSCHRPHASPYQDILRWSYNDMDAGAGANNTGCFVCHTTKDD